MDVTQTVHLTLLSKRSLGTMADCTMILQKNAGISPWSGTNLPVYSIWSDTGVDKEKGSLWSWITCAIFPGCLFLLKEREGKRYKKVIEEHHWSRPSYPLVKVFLWDFPRLHAAGAAKLAGASLNFLFAVPQICRSSQPIQSISSG